jgi:flagellar assembly protein FliH
MQPLRNARPHRFPPLAQVQARTAAPDGSDASQAFQQAMDQGYAEGLRSGKEAGEAQGHRSGHAEGLRQGAEQARREVMAAFDDQAKPVEAILEALKNLQADYQEALREEVVELVGKVARQVIRCELALQPLQLLTMVDETLATLPRVRARDVEVFLHPEDLQRITDLDPERAKKWKLLPDTRLEPGECHVRAGRHEADAGCRQRQAAVMEQVRSQLKGKGKPDAGRDLAQDEDNEDDALPPPALQVVR